jgi:uncharacterized LabA/DUF88 family protein
MARVKCYVDGFNLYHAINDLQRPALKWLSLKALAQLMLRPADELIGVHYFTAVVHWNAEKSRRHRDYIKALKATGVQVVESYFQNSKKACRQFARSCPFYEEKQTDVALAVQVLGDAVSGEVDRQILVTADADQVPLVRYIREQCPEVEIEIAAPPGRLRHARELGALVTWHRELTAGQLMSCLLPRNVPDEWGRIVARCPATYIRN